MALETTSAAAAGTWTLGEVTVSRLGFGAMRLTGSAAFSRGAPSDRDRSIRVLRRAIELGVNHIDTAAFYFSSLRSANELINRALAPYPEGLVIATKVGPYRDASGEWAGSSGPEGLRGQVEENLRQLGLDRLDLVYYRKTGDATVPVADYLGVLAELQEAGLIGQLGLSGVTVAELAQAQAVAPVVSVENRYSLELRDNDDVLRACGEQGIAFVPYFAIAGSAREKGAAGDEHEEVLAVARAHQASPAQVRLAWTLAQGPHVLAIPGTGNPEHLEQNVAAAGLALTDGEMARLNALSAS